MTETVEVIQPCAIESIFRKAGFVVEHDGQHLTDAEKGKLQFVLPPSDIRFFYRSLRLYRNGQPTDTLVWFKYDLRSWISEEPILVDFGTAGKESRGRGKGERERFNKIPREVKRVLMKEG